MYFFHINSTEQFLECGLSMSVRGWLGHGERKCLHVQVDMTRRLLPTILLVSCYLSGDLPAPLLICDTKCL